MEAPLPKTTGSSGSTTAVPQAKNTSRQISTGSDRSGSAGNTLVSATLPEQELTEIRDLLRKFIDALLRLFCGL